MTPLPSSATASVQETLADLRVDIDRIDAELHQLLIARGEIIDRLIAVKARQGGGSAFRPGREADMMRKIVSRHRGLLPVDTVESIWRIIISTFTYVQAPYSVHADISGGDAAMRDCCRFHFGFTVPYIVHQGTGGVVEAVASAKGDLGLVKVETSAAEGAWWRRLAEPFAPKIIARLPFVERPDHPAGMPLFVIAKPLSDAASRETVVYAIGLERWHGSLPECLAAFGGDILGNAADGYGLSLLVAVPGSVTPQSLRDGLRQAGAGEARIAEVGSHAARFDLETNAISSQK
ncbi:chorismate mutase [Beijerinckia indica]|uniref:chorismate mutase n=1 Tax=Beijerinckia indica subsp. indica (strain ATCC 9039 / DSM 1715 / NCIMB 8712) TaxID=395963 RepID=B2IDA3_BEII9|nr:chorismate mutase [Beijerinckia indica]ACB93960.1 Chorismate mutase [Beijerinckia indica subsp. indica ATCC 9039]